MDLAELFSDPPVWVAVAFVIFFLIFGGKIWKALVGMLDKRTEEVRAQLAEAQRLRHEAEAMLAAATAEREAARGEAEAMLATAKIQAETLAKAAAEEAEAAARRRERMAMDRIAAAEKAAVDEVRHAAATLAATAATTVIREDLSPHDDAVLIDGAIASLPAALAPKRAA